MRPFHLLLYLLLCFQFTAAIQNFTGISVFQVGAIDILAKQVKSVSAKYVRLNMTSIEMKKQSLQFEAYLVQSTDMLFVEPYTRLYTWNKIAASFLFQDLPLDAGFQEEVLKNRSGLTPAQKEVSDGLTGAAILQTLFTQLRSRDNSLLVCTSSTVDKFTAIQPYLDRISGRIPTALNYIYPFSTDLMICCTDQQCEPVTISFIHGVIRLTLDVARLIIAFVILSFITKHMRSFTMPPQYVKTVTNTYEIQPLFLAPAEVPILKEIAHDLRYWSFLSITITYIIMILSTYLHVITPLSWPTERELQLLPGVPFISKVAFFEEYQLSYYAFVVAPIMILLSLLILVKILAPTKKTVLSKNQPAFLNVGHKLFKLILAACLAVGLSIGVQQVDTESLAFYNTHLGYGYLVLTLVAMSVGGMLYFLQVPFIDFRDLILRSFAACSKLNKSTQSKIYKNLRQLKVEELHILSDIRKHTIDKVPQSLKTKVDTLMEVFKGDQGDDYDVFVEMYGEKWKSGGSFLHRPTEAKVQDYKEMNKRKHRSTEASSVPAPPSPPSATSIEVVESTSETPANQTSTNAEVEVVIESPLEEDDHYGILKVVRETVRSRFSIVINVPYWAYYLQFLIPTWILEALWVSSVFFLAYNVGTVVVRLIWSSLLLVIFAPEEAQLYLYIISLITTAWKCISDMYEPYSDVKGFVHSSRPVMSLYYLWKNNHEVINGAKKAKREGTVPAFSSSSPTYYQVMPNKVFAELCQLVDVNFFIRGIAIRLSMTLFVLFIFFLGTNVYSDKNVLGKSFGMLVSTIMPLIPNIIGLLFTRMSKMESTIFNERLKNSLKTLEVKYTPVNIYPFVSFKYCVLNTKPAKDESRQEAIIKQKQN